MEVCNSFGCNVSSTASVDVVGGTTTTDGDTTYPVISNIQAVNIIGDGAQIE